MAELIVFDDQNFGGLHTHLFQTTPDFRQIRYLPGIPEVTFGGNWNDRVSSFVIVSGHWQFFTDINFGLQQGGTLGPGLYSFVESFDIDNDAISSVKFVSE
jgi:hypothetical protein